MPFRSVLGEEIAGDVHFQGASIMVHSHTVGSGQSIVTLASFLYIHTVNNMPVLPAVRFTEMDADWHIREEW